MRRNLSFSAQVILPCDSGNSGGRLHSGYFVARLWPLLQPSRLKSGLWTRGRFRLLASGAELTDRLGKTHLSHFLPLPAGFVLNLSLVGDG